MSDDPKIIEERAHQLFQEEKFLEAYHLFRKAATIYKEINNHRQSALCFASAGSSWNKRMGEKSFSNAGLSYMEAAKEAELVKDFEYASLLYKYAAINYEREGDFLSFSECFYQSKECYRKFLFYLLFKPSQIKGFLSLEKRKNLLKYTYLWLTYVLFNLIWGYGERPFRAVLTAFAIIFISTLFYLPGNFTDGQTIFKTNLGQALYFSIITFTTVGYGDITPLGLNRLVAGLEAILGIITVPLFIVGLSRRYLRI